ncbi:hypothetical protein [Glycomyces harbinensis]|uniref:Uncharacterized protein n=1 Tax=Glycomyces harbinensis TaxID=58114 RepID=A0A1G7CPK7_9ACTN|nr:hypothetical protein [Glycomyces harbinensis]SDE41282.1 hypothetical protein SAMN05216270_120108 [Glycomyces harbinensis]
MVGLIARAGLAFGVLLTLAATLLLLSLPSGTAESSISALTVGLGLFLILISFTALYIERKRR